MYNSCVFVYHKSNWSMRDLADHVCARLCVYWAFLFLFGNVRMTFVGCFVSELKNLVYTGCGCR